MSYAFIGVRLILYNKTITEGFEFQTLKAIFLRFFTFWNAYLYSENEVFSAHPHDTCSSDESYTYTTF